MKSKRNTTGELQYKNEHFACESYISDERAILEVIELKVDTHLIHEEVERSTLIFLLSGEMHISTAGALCQQVREGQMFLVSAGDNFHGSAVSDSVLIRCSFTRDLALCNRFSIEQLQKHLPPSLHRERNEISLLPIHSLLFKELELIQGLMQIGMSCIHFQRIKKEALFIELRGLYSKEELALLFAPILSVDNSFKHDVLLIYSQIETAKELTDKMNMSPTVFKRKFQDAFGISPRQWLIQKKKEKLIRDLLMTNMTIAELAEKYKFTVNYMTTFCREHFGQSPTELRLAHKR